MIQFQAQVRGCISDPGIDELGGETISYFQHVQMNKRFFFILFIYLVREHKQAEGNRERGRESSSRFPTEHRVPHRILSHDPEIMT